MSVKLRSASADVALGNSTPRGRGKRDVVRFRPRCAKADGTAGAPNISLLLSLAKYERAAQEDKHRERMILNGLVFVVTAALITIGVWLASNIGG
jgi:hypothetical protein